jgi:hypothetical protein
VDQGESRQKEFKEILLKINTDQKKDVMEKLPKYFKKSGLKLQIDDMFDMEEWRGITIDLITPVMRDIFKREGKIAAEGVGAEGIDVLATSAGKKVLQHSIELFGQSYNETTAKFLKTALSHALTDDATLDQAIDLVNRIYNQADVVRADSSSRTETFRIANEGAKQGWKDSGVVKTMKWYTAEDEMVCQFCSLMDGKVINIDDNFLDEGDVLTGKTRTMTVDYSDVSAPPLHTNCRCFIQPEEVSID